MHTDRSTTFALIAATTLGAAALFAGPARAAAINDTTLDVFDAVDNDFIPGNSTPVDHYVQDNVAPTAGTGTLSVAVKPRDRDTGQANAIFGNRYAVDPGASSNNPNRPNLSINYQFDPGTDNTTNYVLRLSVDFDPAAGAADFAVASLPVFGAGGWNETDGYFLNGQTGSKA